MGQTMNEAKVLTGLKQSFACICKTPFSQAKKKKKNFPSQVCRNEGSREEILNLSDYLVVFLLRHLYDQKNNKSQTWVSYLIDPSHPFNCTSLPSPIYYYSPYLRHHEPSDKPLRAKC